VGKVHVAMPLGQILLMQRFDPDQMVLEQRRQGRPDPSGTLQSSLRRERGPRASAYRETARTARSSPHSSVRYEWTSGGDGVHYGRRRGVLVVDFSSWQAYLVSFMMF
jgi:hypothetical protein